MRPSYIFAVVIVATIAASGSAVSVTEESKPTIENETLLKTADAAKADGALLLRRTDKNIGNNADHGEERFSKKVNGLWKWLQKTFHIKTAHIDSKQRAVNAYRAQAKKRARAGRRHRAKNK
ncbi:RxLR effector protein [Phytophthora megakarya]|uniref:RxLR effector protein n=1 Tax=Phytophthora megakarya TaxID=4795 RepID=A0A225VZB8_9STRA|nr:RxLR effector protein [Phytophthora megakarya]